MLIGRNSAGLRLVTTIEDLAAMLVDLTPAEASVLAPLCVFLAALLTAWNANLNGFVWDDRSAVLSNLDTQSSSLYEIFTHDFWGMDIRSVHSHKSYRPLTILSFRLNFMMAGGHSAWLYHVTNAAVHAGCALLCYCVACVLFRQHHDRERGRSSGPTANDTENPQDDSLKNPALDDAERSEKGVSIGALSAGLLFAVHPIHCDAVASIVGRADLLCTCLSLMAFLAYVRGAATTGYGVTSWSCVALALTLTIASGLCKELGFTTFALLVVYDVLGFCSEKHEGSKLRAMKFRLMVTAIVGIVAAATRVWINGEHRQMEWNILANNIVVQESRLTRILSYAHVHAWYLWKLVWPRWFCFDYGYNTVPVIETITDFRNLYTLLAYIVVWVGARAAILQLTNSRIYQSRSSSLLMMSIAFGVIPFVPAANILFPVGTVVAERLLYFPSVGFCLLLGCVVDRTSSITGKYYGDPVPERVEIDTGSELVNPPSKHVTARFFGTTRSLLLTCGPLLLATGCYRSHVRNAEWFSEETLFKAAVEVVPTNVKVLSNQAKNLLNPDPEQALEYLRVSLGMIPKHIESHLNAGLSYVNLATNNDDNEEHFLNGVRHLHKSAMLAPKLYPSPGFLGTELFKYWMLRQKDEDKISLEEFLASDTIASATRFLDHALRQNSVFPTHFYHRAIIAYESGDYDEAIKFFRMTELANAVIRDRQVDPELLIEPAVIYNMLGACYSKKKQLNEALEILRTGISKHPEETDLHVNTALILLELDNPQEAEAQLKAGLIASKERYHIPKLRHVAKVLESHGLLNAVDLFLDHAARLEREYSG